MYLRIRKLEPADLKPGDHSLMVAQETDAKGKIVMRPGQLEWWDGLQWNVVEIVSKEATNESPWRHS